MTDSPRSGAELAKRYMVFFVATYLLTLGIVLTSRGDMGTSPISTLPYIFSLKFPSLSFGTWSFLWNILMLLSQVLIRRRHFKLIQLMQVPLVLLFSLLLDLNNFLLSAVSADTFVGRVGLTLLGCLVLGLAVALTVEADVLMTTGEAATKAIADQWHFSFSSVKVVFEVCLFGAGVGLSFGFFGTLHGVGLGTLLTALLTAPVVRVLCRRLHPALAVFFAPKRGNL
ncbi:MAG: DUF6198 family protein [Eubacteriales bacterium]